MLKISNPQCNLSIFKKLLYAIFFGETNLEPLTASRSYKKDTKRNRIFFKTNSSHQGVSRLVLPNKIAYGDFLKKSYNFYFTKSRNFFKC